MRTLAEILGCWLPSTIPINEGTVLLGTMAEQPDTDSWHLLPEMRRQSRTGRMQEQVEFCWGNAHTSPQTRCHSPRLTPEHYLQVYFNCTVTWDLSGPGKASLEQSHAARLVLHQDGFQQVGWWFVMLHYFVYCSMNSFVADCGRICLFLSPCVQVLSVCQHSKLNCWWKDTDPTLEVELFQLLMQVRFWDRQQKGKKRQMQGMRLGGRNFGSGFCPDKQQGALLRRSRRLHAGLGLWRQLMRV